MMINNPFSCSLPISVAAEVTKCPTQKVQSRRIERLYTHTHIHTQTICTLQLDNLYFLFYHTAFSNNKILSCFKLLNN